MLATPHEGATPARWPLVLGLAVGLFCASAPNLALAQSREAAMQARIGQLEEEIRQLTGRLEEAEFAHRRLSARIDELVADLDDRLAEREPSAEPRFSDGDARERPVASVGEPGTGSASSGAAPRQRPASPGEAGSSAVEAARSAVGERARREDGNLGSIPADAAPPPAETAEPNRELPEPAPGGLAAASDAEASERYEAALGLLREGNWATAQRAFGDLLEAFPNDPLAPGAAYWLAETLFVRSQYAEAASTFARNYRVYGADAPKAPDNLLKLSMSLTALGDSEKACRALDRLDSRHSDLSMAIRQAARRERDRAGCG